MSLGYNQKKRFREPTNEKGVFYLFSRNHEKLGFEEIKEFVDGTPDLIALEGGKEVGLEIENSTAGAFVHYCAIKATEQMYNLNNYPGEWQKIGNVWTYLSKGKEIMSFAEEPSKPCAVDPQTRRLLYKNAKSVGIDIIVYWKEDTWRFWEWDKEVRPFSLQKELQRIGVI